MAISWRDSFYKSYDVDVFKKPVPRLKSIRSQTKQQGEWADDDDNGGGEEEDGHAAEENRPLRISLDEPNNIGRA